MAGLIEPLPWDTEFFGIPIGRVSLDGADAERLAAIDAQAREMGIVCLYGSLDPMDDDANRWAQLSGHRLVEVALTFDRRKGPFVCPPSASTARRGTVADVADLESPIRTLAPWSRFGADPRFGHEAAYRMHRAWIERAARDGKERALFVAADADGVTGVATTVRSPVPRLDIAGVTKPGSGACDVLIAAFIDWAGGGDVQAGPCAARNLPPVRILERWGFRVCQSRYIFHCWLDEVHTLR
jgi:hypothetical protein